MSQSLEKSQMGPLGRNRELLMLIGLTLAGLVFSGLDPYDRTTWWLEVAPVLVLLPILILTGRRSPLTRLAYRLLFVQGLILILGGHYTYARVPVGFWLQDLFDLTRNHYDRLGHLAQGFVPAMLVREILLKKLFLPRGGWLLLIVSSICLAFSACYEFVEWWAALLGGASAEAFLGTQGDVWDTQWDMFLALIGSLLAQLLLAGRQDRELGKLYACRQITLGVAASDTERP